jgi:ATP-dependent Clp protease ATP-binding subunit ClpA
LVGQDEAVVSLIGALKALSRRPAGVSEPLGVLLLSGPSGVGKTLTAEVLSRALFGAGEHLGRFNMSELKERHELSRLIGAPPGFLGHESQGTLFRFVGAHPQGLILLDEMEKAHPEIQDYFLQIFDKGEAGDADGQKADFRRHLFVMTCNVVPEPSAPVIGFLPGPEVQASVGPQRLRTHFREEFLARVDQIVWFAPLTEGPLRILLARCLERLKVEVQETTGRPLQVTQELEQSVLTELSKDATSVRAALRAFEQLVRAPVLEVIEALPDGPQPVLEWSDAERRVRRVV